MLANRLRQAVIYKKQLMRIADYGLDFLFLFHSKQQNRVIVTTMKSKCYDM